MRRWAVGLMLLALAAADAAEVPSGPAAVYFIPMVRFVDHFNVQLTQDRLEAALRFAETSKMTPLFLFSGSVADILAEENPHTHLADRIRELVRQGKVEIGYDGSEEPTPWTRPQANFRNAHTPDEYWLARVQAVDWFLSEAKDPLFGDPDGSKRGGLDQVMATLGMPSFVTGIYSEMGGDSELVHLLRRRGVQTILSGVSGNDRPPGRNMHGFRGAAVNFGQVMSACSTCSSEVYWQDGFLHLSTAEGGSTRIFPAYQGIAALQKMLATSEPAHSHFVFVDLFSERDYLKSSFLGAADATATVYGYNNPKAPMAAENAYRPAEEVKASLDAEASVMADLAGRPFVSMRQLANAAQRYTVPKPGDEQVRRAAVDLLEQWAKSGFEPPSFAKVDERFFSLAEMFALLVARVGDADPAAVGKASGGEPVLFGPSLTAEVASSGANQVAVKDVLESCRRLWANWQASEGGWQPLPRRMVPAVVRVGQIEVNSGQFLKVLARLCVTPMSSGEIRIENAGMISVAGYAVPMSVRPNERRAAWTMKPAPLGNLADKSLLVSDGDLHSR